MAHQDENTETERKRYPFEKHNKTINDNAARLLENSKNVTGTDVAGDKRAEDVYVRNPDSDPVPVNLPHLPLTTSTIYNNTTHAVAGTETSQALSADTKKFTIINTSLVETLQVAYAAGDSGTDFITLRPDTSHKEELLLVTGFVIYYQSTGSAQRLEIIEWT